MTANETGMRNHHMVTVRVSDEHFAYLQAKKTAGTPIAEVIRQVLAAHLASETDVALRRTA